MVAKKFMDKKLGRVSKFSVEFFLSHSAENFRRRTRIPSVLCFRKVPRTKMFMNRKGGVSHFSVENILSKSAQKFRRGIS